MNRRQLLADGLWERSSLKLAEILGFAPRPSRPLPRGTAHTAKKTVALCHSLLSERGEVSGSRLAAEALDSYKALDNRARRAFFESLIREFSPDPEEVGRAGDAYRDDPSAENLARLQRVVEPPRQELFRRLNLAPDGTRILVAMRSQVLQESDRTSRLKPIAADLAHLFTSWFNRGFLVLRRIDWQTSAVVLEKLIQYEAVHQIQGWHDLRRRLESDRRCYAFFHPALPDEPIIFIEVALTRGLSDTVQALLDPDSPVLDAESAEWAVFYSITNCQDGLRGVPFGSFLIKRVVENLSKELPRIKKFATLSPVTGFRKWLSEKAAAMQCLLQARAFRRCRHKTGRSAMDGGRGPARGDAALLASFGGLLPIARQEKRRTAGRRGALPSQERSASGAHQLAGRHLRVRITALGRPHRQLRL